MYPSTMESCPFESLVVSRAAALAVSVIDQRQAGLDARISAMAPVHVDWVTERASRVKLAPKRKGEKVKVGERSGRPITCKTCTRALPRTDFVPGADGKINASKGPSCRACHQKGNVSKGGKPKKKHM